ncbi:MAG: PTS mannose transporter subunit IIAB [Pantoea sp. Brub]|nr:PTS mannose transporter subunit IIAB [Pantoea sp. Brub]
MTIAIIIGTHGWVAEQLLKAAEMLIGDQQNIEFVDFVPGENTETLIEKYQQKIQKLNTSKGLIFLVDTWGGSPFNAANHIVSKKDNYDVIVGINIPMLIEILMVREDNPNFQDLVSIAIKTGRKGIKALKTQLDDLNNISLYTNKPICKEEIKPGLLNNMKIALVRIDDRLIHGQITMDWAKKTNVTRIIVVNNEVSQDNVRKMLLQQSTPPGIMSHVINVDKMARIWNNPNYSQDIVMLLFTNPTDILNVITQGVNIQSVNIGGMSFKKEKIRVSDAVSVDQQDILAFKKLHDLNIELEIRKVSSDQKIKIMDLIDKLNII